MTLFRIMSIDFSFYFCYNEEISSTKTKMKNLNHHDIHEIFTQISQSLVCPQCQSQILPNNIRINDIVDNECIFDVDCHRCKSEMTLSAQIEKNTTDTAKTYNKSSQLMHDSVVEEGITEWEVKAMKDELKNFCGSFIETFCKY